MADIFDSIQADSPSSKGDIFDLISSPSNGSKMNIGDLAFDTYARAGMGAYDATKWIPGVKQLANMTPGTSADELSQNLQSNANLGQKVVQGTGQAIASIPQMLSFIKAAGAIPMLGKMAGGALAPIVGMAGYGATKAATQGQPVGQGALEGAGQGLIYSAGGAAGALAGKMALNPLALAIGGNVGSAIFKATPTIGSMAGMGTAGALTAPQGDKIASGIVGGALGAFNPIGQKSYENILQDHADAYRDILNPGKGIIQKFEIKSKKDLNEAMKLAAQDGVIIDRDSENKLDTRGAVAQLQPKISGLHDQLNQVLDSDPHKQFDLEDIRSEAKKNLSGSIKNAEDLKAAHNQVDNAIDAEIDRNGQFVNGKTLNNIKQGLWSKSYDPLAPNSNKVSRQIGNSAKDMIEQGYSGDDVKGLNQSMGKYLDLQNILSASHGNIVQAGKMGQHFGRLTGLGVGGAIGHVIPVPGSEAMGAVIGQQIGSKIPEWMNDPRRLTTDMANKIKMYQMGQKAQIPAISQAQGTPSQSPQVPIPQLPSPQAPMPSYLQQRQNIPSMNIPNGSAVSSNPIPMRGAIQKSTTNQTNPSTFNPLTNPVSPQGLPPGVKALGAAALIGAGSMFNPLNAQASQVKEPERLQLPADQYTKKEEGFQAHPYIDTKGNKTIGYGFKMDAVGKYLPKLVQEGKRPLTKPEADDIYTKLYANARGTAQDFAGDSWHSLNGQQQKALSDMAYNMGGKLNGFKNLRQNIEDGDFQSASREILNSKYAKEAKNRAMRNATLIAMK